VLDGVDDVLNLGDLSAAFPTAATLFVAMSVTDTEWSAYATHANSSRWRFTDGKGYLGVFRSTRVENFPTAMPSAGAYVFTVQSSSAAYQVFQNGASLGTAAAGFLGGTAHAIGVGTSDYLAGDVYEIVAYNSVLSSVVRAQVEHYLNTRWSLY